MKLIHCLTVAASSLLLTSLAQAAFFAQSADITKNTKFTLTPTSEIASYNKDGKSGDVTFVCDLEGDGAEAWLLPGKNFGGNAMDLLKVGINGPYKWTLHDYNENNGNIKVSLARGDKATIQCLQVG